MYQTSDNTKFQRLHRVYTFYLVNPVSTFVGIHADKYSDKVSEQDLPQGQDSSPDSALPIT